MRYLRIVALLWIPTVSLALDQVEGIFQSPSFQEGLKAYSSQVNYKAMKSVLSPEEVAALVNPMRHALEKVSNAMPAYKPIDAALANFNQHPYSVTYSLLACDALDKYLAINGVLLLNGSAQRGLSAEQIKAVSAMDDTISANRDRVLAHARTLALWADQSNAAKSYPGGSALFWKKHMAELQESAKSAHP